MASPHENYPSFGDSSCLPCASGWNNNLWEARTSSSQPSHDGNNSSNAKQIEDILSSELSKLSVKERSEAYDDVHCVGDELQETPEMVQRSLLEFEQAIPRYRNTAYELACKQNKAYIEDPSFRLRFLRAQMHNVDKAVAQMMKFLKYKGEFFGEDKIASEITLDDLDEEDMELMLSGLFHIQAERDRMGRIIVYLLSKMWGRFKPESTYRVNYYMWWNIIGHCTEVQSKGIVLMYLDTPRPEEEDLYPESDTSVHKLLDATLSLPLRSSACHYLLKQADNASQMFENSLLSFTVGGLSLYSRVRTRIHHGTIMELKYKLRGHGIPFDSFPVDMNGNMREDIINTWYYEHLVKEGMISVLPSEGLERNEKDTYPELHPSAVELPQAQSQAQRTKASSVISPSDSDVLSGRGRFLQNHPGNQRFRKFVEDHFHEYDALARYDRMAFTTNLTNILLEDKIRFLEQTTRGDWVTLNLQEVRKKVSQQFRTLRKKHNRTA